MRCAHARLLGVLVERGSTTDATRIGWRSPFSSSAPAGVHRIGRPRHHLRDRMFAVGTRSDDLADRLPRQRLGPRRGDRASRRHRRHCLRHARRILVDDTCSYLVVVTDQFERVNLEAELLTHPAMPSTSPERPALKQALTDDDRFAVAQRRPPARRRQGVSGPHRRRSGTQSMPCAWISSSFWSSVVSSFGVFSDGPHGPDGRRRSPPPNGPQGGRRRLGPAGRPPDDPGAHHRTRRSCRDSGVVGQSITAVVQEFHGASGSGDLEKRYRGIPVGFPPWGCDSYTARSTPSSPSTVHGPTPETPNCSSEGHGRGPPARQCRRRRWLTRGAEPPEIGKSVGDHRAGIVERKPLRRARRKSECAPSAVPRSAANERM